MLDPKQPDAIIIYGDELGALGRTTDSENVYFRLVREDSSVTSYRHLIDILSQRHLNAQVKRAYGEALAKSPDSHALRRDYARWLSASGDLKASLEQWKQIQAQSKDSFLRNFAIREIGRIERAQLLK